MEQVFFNVPISKLEPILKRWFKETLNELQTKPRLQNQPDAEDLLTRKEACKLLQIDSSTLWNWTNKGRVTAYGIANRRYYKRSELMKSLKPLNTQRHEQ